jgi:hypothetical protein
VLGRIFVQERGEETAGLKNCTLKSFTVIFFNTYAYDYDYQTKEDKMEVMQIPWERDDMKGVAFDGIGLGIWTGFIWLRKGYSIELL